MKYSPRKLLRRLLPFLFYRWITFDGHRIYWPYKWTYSKKEIEDIERRADELASIFDVEGERD